MTPDQEEFRRRAVRAVLAVAGIAVVIGLVIGGLTSAGIYFTGVLPEPTSTPALVNEGPSDSDDLPSPSLAPTREPPSPSETAPTPEATSSPTSPSPSPTSSPSRSREPRPDQPITLRASASSAGSFDEVTLSGRYPGGNGTTLQVQRLEGGSWASFPTSATVRGGTFSTFVASGTPGPNRFRVVDPGTGRVSNVVTFTVS